jgi:hypothetical protein
VVLPPLPARRRHRHDGASTSSDPRATGVETNDLRERLAAELLASPYARPLIVDARRLADDDSAAAVRLVVLRLRQGHPDDDAMRATIERAGRILDRGRRAG